MADTMKKMKKNPNVEIISKEMIKPSQPTPSHLRTYQISSLDQFFDRTSYIRVLFFYDTPVGVGVETNQQLIQVNLKNSLSEALTHYYPLAGKFVKDQPFVDCDDSGAEFTTAVIVDDGDYHDCFGIIENLDIDFLDKLVTKDDYIVPKSDDVILAIQITQFTGGNFTVGVCISHKISDATTLSSFLKCWSAAANIIFSGKSKFKEVIFSVPIFDAYKLWPSIPGLTRPSFNIAKSEKVIMQKLSFSSSNLTKLKLELSGGGEDDVVPTRVTSVMALIWHVMMNSSSPPPPPDKHVLTMWVNIRGKMSPPLPENTFGNVVKLAVVGKSGGDGDLRLVLGLIKEATGRVDSEYAKIQGTPTEGPFMSVFTSDKNHKIDITVANSWCRLGFYDVDLGLGKPIWMTSLRRPNINDMLLLDGPNGGIDVLIGLNQETLERFEKNPILLAFCDNKVTYG